MQPQNLLGHLPNKSIKARIMMSEDDKNWLKKCPGCPCTFFSVNDMKRHQKAFGTGNHEEEFHKLHRQAEHYEQEDEQTWIQSKYGNKQLILSSKDPRLAQAIRQNGSIKAGGYTYTFSTDQKWILKEVA
jgi:hypothetical protein